MFNKVLIANRGVIAVRIIRTLSRMGIKSVVVYSESDQDSLHVSLADEAYSLGVGGASDTYLNQTKLFDVIERSGAQAVHPGYGFLSENPNFVRKCERRGIRFIGPTPEQMEVFGLKHTARELARDCEVPLLPGSELLNDIDVALQQAQAIGYPVMLKSTAGGGGIGMQLCRSDDDLIKSFGSVRRLSQNNFSNSGVFIEKYIEYARHIEVQIFGDGKGNAVALGDRDCSTQRRNQKVIEETPAPNVPIEVRDKLGRDAVHLVTAVNYLNVGTVEFLYDQQCDQFYFLEVNTRLQVEHGVTEQVYGVDLVECMVRLAAGEDVTLPSELKPNGHAIQVRLYAEDPHKDFQPSAGLVSHIAIPQADNLRIEHCLESGIEVSPYFDPMLAKVIVTEPNRELATQSLIDALCQIEIYGIETNVDYVKAVLDTPEFRKGRIFTRYLNSFAYSPSSIDVISAGTMTTVQEYPGRKGYWDVGVPPSGPFDNYSFRLGNRQLGNDICAAGLEITLNGPTLRFNTDTQIVLSGAPMNAMLNNQTIPFWQVIEVKAGQVLQIGKTVGAGARAYLLVRGGFQTPRYLDSRSTFTLGQFGGHCGRALRVGDVLHIDTLKTNTEELVLDQRLLPDINSQWELNVIYGPHGAPDFFTDDDIATFFESEWEVHYNSSRTGVRLVGPKPQWARSDGGEAGMHPSNIHDNAYAIGTIDFTGDMPVILGPDGPSLGGFVCPATVITADLWKLGQLKAGDKIRFHPISIDDARQMERKQRQSIDKLQAQNISKRHYLPASPVIKTLSEGENGIAVVYRPSGDHYLLVEYGPLILDIKLRFRVHALMLWLQSQSIAGVEELTPGIRSLQIHYDSQVITLEKLIQHLAEAEQHLEDYEDLVVPARIVHLPLSWDDQACQLAIEKYMQSVRKDAPWCPSNIEFIRRINGLPDVDAVKKTVFDASYLVMGLGDVYLGAPVATPMDPRHRLVTTKYNPARTWTAENSVGIGGAYMCIYGMEGPGGYQFVGRTLQQWNRYNKTEAFRKPWLLRFFDQVRFFEVTHDELENIRRDFPKGRYSIRIEETEFSLKNYQQFLVENDTDIVSFQQRRQVAFDDELQRWVESGQIDFESSQDLLGSAAEEEKLPENCIAIESSVAGNVWKVLVSTGDRVEVGQAVVILESMKMEIEIQASHSGSVYAISRSEGSQVSAGQVLLVLQED